MRPRPHPLCLRTATRRCDGSASLFDHFLTGQHTLLSQRQAPEASCLTKFCDFAAFTSLAPNKINVNITSYTINNQTVPAGAPCTNMVPDNACLTQVQAARDMIHIDYSVKTGVRLLAPCLPGLP